MTTNNWKEQFAKDYTTKVFYGDSIEENTKNSLAYFTDFIETQIALARKEGAEEMKGRCINTILNCLFLDMVERNATIERINSISSL